MASKSNVNCAVYGCASVRKNNPELSFHSFPKEGQKVSLVNDFGEREECNRRRLWEMKLRMGKKVSEFMRVCSLHFKNEDFEHSGCDLWTGKKVLLPSAIPSMNLPRSAMALAVDEKECEIKTAREQRLQGRRLQKKREELDIANENHLKLQSIEAAETLILLGEQQPKFREIGIQTDDIEVCKCFEKINTKNTSVQVDTRSFSSVSDFVKTDKQLNSLTGIHSLKLFNGLVTLLCIIIEDKRVHRLSVFNRLFLVLMKLKLDMPYVVLSVLFGVSAQTCKNIFFDIIPRLACILRSCISLPSSDEIERNIRTCFIPFQKVRIVLDCIELPVQQHRRLCCRIKTYSHYKGKTTIKFMTGVSPGGLITYVSKAYGGRTSDNAIFQRSGILDKLTAHEDQIMVDKGFLIEQLCQSYGIKIIRPPFLRNKKQFSHAEAIENAKIASARVHIERTNARIKIFQMLSNISVEVIPLVDDIFNVICGIVNLSNSILADDKFICSLNEFD